MGSLNGWINPLKFVELEGPWNHGSLPSADEVVAHLSGPGLDRDVAGFCQRYRELAESLDPIPIVGADAALIEKFVWPLRHAKGSYALGNHVGCIALCGFVSEMAAILLWDISEHGRCLPHVKQVGLFGSAYEKLGQRRRVEVLLAHDLISEEIAVEFDLIRQLRRKYLHFLSHDHGRISVDSKRAICAVMAIVSDLLRPTFENGQAIFRDDVTRYLKEKGVLVEAEDENVEDAIDDEV
jgi:hypothetical protein